MTVMVCIWLTSRRIVAEKVRVLSLFGTKPGYECGRPVATDIACSPLPLKGGGSTTSVAELFDPLPLRSFGAKRPPLFKGRFSTLLLAAALMPAAGDKDLRDTDHDLEADQDHDDDLEPQRAAGAAECGGG